MKEERKTNERFIEKLDAVFRNQFEGRAQRGIFKRLNYRQKEKKNE